MPFIDSRDLDHAVSFLVQAAYRVRDEGGGLLMQPQMSQHGIAQMARRSILYVLTEAAACSVHELPHEEIRRITGSK